MDLGRLLRPGDRVLDIGANIGLVTLWMSKLIGPKGIVHAFEPNSFLCSTLANTFAHNAITNVRLHSVALGASEGEMELHVPAGNLGGASLTRRTSQTEQVYTVPVAQLDEIMLPEARSGIAFIKLDVEGFEFEVLKGARQILTEVRPSAILFESNEEYDGHDLTPTTQLLHDWGYDFLVIPHCLIRMKTAIANVDQPETLRSHDIIAVPKGEVSARMRRRLRAG